MRLGDNISFEKDGVIHTERVGAVHYSSGSPAIYRDLNWWQRMARRVTPRRWRTSLLVREAQLPSITISGGTSPPTGKTLAQIEQIQSEIGKTLGAADE